MVPFLLFSDNPCFGAGTVLGATGQEQMKNAVFALKELKIGQQAKQNKTESIVSAMRHAGSPQWGQENKFGHVG